jgi:hypothetical protein
MVRDTNSSPSSAALQRDAALARISRTRRWMLAGAAALTAALAGLASALVPGKSLGAKTRSASVAPRTTTKSSSSSVAPSLPPPAGASALGLQGSEQSSGSSGDSSSASSGSQAAAPQPAPQPAPAPAPVPAPSGGGAATSGGS